MSANLSESRFSRLKNQIIPKLVKEGKFKNTNEETEIENVVIHQTDAGCDHWASATVFAEVHLKNQGVSTIEKIVVKYSPINESFRKFLVSDVLYKNEIAIYQDVIPRYSEFLKKQSDKLGDPEVATLLDGMFSVCYYADYDPKEPEHAVVILNNASVDGFGSSKHRTNLDFDHVKLCLTNLAKYHGVGYSYKLANKTEYEEIMSKIQQVRWSELDRPAPNRPLMSKLSAQRAIRRLIKENTGEIKLAALEKLERIYNFSHDVMIHLTRKGESSVLCHGDFCVNNLLFRYDQSGKPEKLKLIDFQTPIYGSPAIDLSFFMLISTSRNFRNQNFYDLFQFYHSMVVDTISKILGRPVEEPGFTFEDFEMDYANHAAYAYQIVSFFLPIMMTVHKEPFDLEEDVRKDDVMTEEERRVDIEKRGGEEVTQILVSVFKELYHNKCFDDLLNNFPLDKFEKKVTKD